MPRIKSLRPYVRVWATDHEVFNVDGETFAEGDYDHAQLTVIGYDREDFDSPVDFLVKVLQDQPCSIEPSQWPLRGPLNGVWFGGSDHEANYTTDDYVEYSVHPGNFAPWQIQSAWLKYNRSYS